MPTPVSSHRYPPLLVDHRGTPLVRHRGRRQVVQGSRRAGPRRHHGQALEQPIHGRNGQLGGDLGVRRRRFSPSDGQRGPNQVAGVRADIQRNLTPDGGCKQVTKQASKQTNEPARGTGEGLFGVCQAFVSVSGVSQDAWSLAARPRMVCSACIRHSSVYQALRRGARGLSRGDTLHSPSPRPQ